MTLGKQMASTIALAVAMLIGAVLSAPPAQAAYTVTLEQVGSNVVATGSGTIDLTGLTGPVAPGDITPFVDPSLGQITTGPPGLPEASADGWYTVTGPVSGPTSFGSGGFTIADTGSGAPVGIRPDVPNQLSLVVPHGYASGGPLSDTSTYDNATLASLGVTPGTYEWTWGSGAIDDTFTLDAVVPEPSILALLGVALAGLPLVRTRRRIQPSGWDSRQPPKIPN